ncbi:hypothetical protein [Lunatimonas salinarum]|uniref:hypothetical protein n=1 Tax=Lunatimonas salinarum TaxID=1774590 RepID=UPI001ADED395|nr:hypothetical protein [Lunatimonas salinarum]
MKSLLTIAILLLFFQANSQQLSGNVKNHGKAEMDLVLMLFGMDYPISIGKVDKKGAFTASLADTSLEKIPDDYKSMSMGPLYFNFHFNCSPDAFGDQAEKPAARQDYVRMTNGKGEWAGTVFLLSDEALKPWLEDSGYNNAVKGSFYEVMYVDEDVELSTSCTSSVYADDNTEVPVEYVFEISLKKGFNWVEYTIDEVYKTNPDVRASFPSKVTITNLKDPSKMHWIGVYY